MQISTPLVKQLRQPTAVALKRLAARGSERAMRSIDGAQRNLRSVTAVGGTTEKAAASPDKSSIGLPPG